MLKIQGEGGENEATPREEHLTLIIDNDERAKLGHSKNERMEKVKMNT